MKNVLVILSVVVIGVFLFFLKTQDSPIIHFETRVLPENQPHAVWDWHATERDNIHSYFARLNKIGITTVYADISGYVDIYESTESTAKTTADARFRSSLNTYIAAANKEDITVHALVGHPEWGNASHRYLNGILIDFVHDYNATNPETTFTGIQFDIEPHSQSHYNTGNAEQIFAEFLSTAKYITEQILVEKNTPLGGTPLEIGFAIPYWVDGDTHALPDVNWSGNRAPVFNHLVEILSDIGTGYLVIMAYRNTAEGEDGTLAHVAREMEYIEQTGIPIKIVVGQETSDVEPAIITYHGTNFAEMIDELEKITEPLSVYSHFAGFAYNNVDSLLELHSQK